MQSNLPRTLLPGDLADPPAAGPANARGEEASTPGQQETNPPLPSSPLGSFPAQAEAAKPERTDADWRARLRDLYGGQS